MNSSSVLATAAAEAMMNERRSNISTAATEMNSVGGGTSVPSGCEYASSNTYAAGSFFVMLFLFFACKFLHITLFHRFFGQPRITSEITVGLILGNLAFMDQFLELVIPMFNSFSEIGMSCYLLVLGLEMDPTVLFHKPTREVIVAYIGTLTSFVIASLVTPILKLSIEDSVGFVISLSLTITGTSSQVITRLVTDLKISKSDMGTLVIGAGMHSDMISMLLFAIFLVFRQNNGKEKVGLIEGGFIIFLLTMEMIMLAKVFPSYVRWMNERNPEGKPMKGSDLIIFVTIMCLLCSIGPIVVGYSPTMTSFLVGLIFPRKGRITKMVVGNINQMMSFIFFPIFFCWVGALASFESLRFNADKLIGMKLFLLYVAAMIGKIAGAILSGLLLGFNSPVAIAIGLFLNIKGYFHIFVAAISLQDSVISTGSYIVLIFFSILSIAPVPWLVKSVVEHTKKQSTYKRMAIQWVAPNTELHMLLCLHGPQNVPSMINIMEVSRGNSDLGIDVYVTDMIEVNNNCHSTMFIPDHLLHHQDQHFSADGGVRMADESVVDMREQITNAILSYVEKSNDGINVHRLLAISTFANMHQDLCNLAEAVQASLLILPFHRNQRKDGKMDNVHHGFRHVNRKVLRQAPCSVGILVDRGLESINSGSLSSSMVTLHVVVVFIGGKDDREALAYAARISQHPGINLTAIRFLQDNNAEKTSSRAKKPRAKRAMEEQELRLDDEYFAEFYEKKVAHGKVGYVEKHVVNAKEMVSTLKSLERRYAIFIVGRARRVNSIFTAGMNDWEECPDLGPIGEILADSDFSTTASVLVIQQHSLGGLENEFTLM